LDSRETAEPSGKNVHGEGFEENDGRISFVEETLMDTKVDGECVGVNYG
jgi:hypothetical protein